MSVPAALLAIPNGPFSNLPIVVDVYEERRILPCNPWPEDERMKLCGQYMMTNVCDGFRGVGWKMFRHLGLSADEIEQLIGDCKKEVCSQKYRVWLPV